MTYPELQGKVAVISGAGGNLGLAVAKRLQNEGVRLALLDRDAASLRRRLVEAGLTLDGVHLYSLDLTRKVEVDQAVAEVIVVSDRIDILVNIAGGFKADGPVHEMPEATWDFLMNLNAKTAFLLSAAAAARMVSAGHGGRIVNVGARAALSGVAGIAAYSASKAAVLRLTESMAGELLPHRITVNAIMPSVIDTPQNRAANPNDDFTRWVSPESLAGVIAFLVSDAARDISGGLIPVYGQA